MANHWKEQRDQLPEAVKKKIGQIVKDLQFIDGELSCLADIIEDNGQSDLASWFRSTTIVDYHDLSKLQENK